MTVERFFFLLGEIIPTAIKKLHSDRLFSFLVEICQQFVTIVYNLSSVGKITT